MYNVAQLYEVNRAIVVLKIYVLVSNIKKVFLNYMILIWKTTTIHSYAGNTFSHSLDKCLKLGLIIRFTLLCGK